MLTQRLVASAPRVIKRNIGILAPAFQQARDPIQQLFVDKIREYKEQSIGGKLLESNPEIAKEKKAELDRIARQYNIKGEVTQFPKFSFKDPEVEK